MKKTLILLILFFLRTYSMELGIQKNQESAISAIENLPIDVLHHIGHYLMNFENVYNMHDVFKDIKNFKLASKVINNKLKDIKFVAPSFKIKLEHLEIGLDQKCQLSLEQIKFILKKNNQMLYKDKKSKIESLLGDIPRLLRLWKEIEIIKKIEDKEIIDDIRDKII